MFHFAVVIWYEGVRYIKSPLLHAGDGFLRALTEDVNNYLVHLSDARDRDAFLKTLHRAEGQQTMFACFGVAFNFFQV